MLAVTLVIVLYVLAMLAGYYSIYLYWGNEHWLKRSLLAHVLALISILFILILHKVYGTYFPFYEPGKPYFHFRPYEWLLTVFTYISFINFTYTAFLATIFIKHFIQQIYKVILLRIILTLIYLFVAYALTLLLLFFTCGFGTAECCC